MTTQVHAIFYTTPLILQQNLITGLSRT